MPLPEVVSKENCNPRAARNVTLYRVCFFNGTRSVGASKICIFLLSGAPLLLGQDASALPLTPDGSVVAAPSDVTGSDITPGNFDTGQADTSQVGSDADAGRILGVIPDNKIVPSHSTGEPLTRRAKFSLAFKDSTDPFTFVLAGFYAGISEWNDQYPKFGEGASGYGKRFGAAYADQVIGNYFTEAIVPSIMHQDPRYFRMGSGPKLRRLGYALTRTVVTRTDRGCAAFNYSEIVGNGIAAGLSNFYYPRADRTVSETAEKLGVQVVSDSAFNVLLEFWPDMRHLILKR